jgi:hypothetical protein
MEELMGSGRQQILIDRALVAGGAARSFCRVYNGLKACVSPLFSRTAASGITAKTVSTLRWPAAAVCSVSHEALEAHFYAS